MKASTHLHNLMYQGVTRATMFFFNTNPSGRILNRFSKDMGQVDEILPSVMIDVIQIFLSLGGIIVVVAIVNYWFLVPTIIIGIIFYFLRNFYLMTSRNIKRMEATSNYDFTQISNRSTTTKLISIFSSFSDLLSSWCFVEWTINNTCVWCAGCSG